MGADADFARLLVEMPEGCVWPPPWQTIPLSYSASPA